jgi:hypothetical protein
MQRDRLVTGSQSQPVGDCLGHQHPVEGVRRQSRERGSRELAEARVPYLLGEVGRSGEFPVACLMVISHQGPAPRSRPRRPRPHPSRAQTRHHSLSSSRPQRWRYRCWLLRLRRVGGRLLLRAAQSQQLMPERRVDESTVVRISGARMGVPVEEAAGEAHLDDRDLALLL